MGIVYVCVFLCLYMIEDTEVSLTAGVGAALLVFVLILVSNQFFRNRQEKMADSIVRYSENYLRSCIGDAIYNETESDEGCKQAGSDGLWNRKYHVKESGQHRRYYKNKGKSLCKRDLFAR